MPCGSPQLRLQPVQTVNHTALSASFAGPKRNSLGVIVYDFQTSIGGEPVPIGAQAAFQTKGQQSGEPDWIFALRDPAIRRTGHRRR